MWREDPPAWPAAQVREIARRTRYRARIRVTRADDIRSHFKVSLYHFMVHISENKKGKIQ